MDGHEHQRPLRPLCTQTASRRSQLRRDLKHDAGAAGVSGCATGFRPDTAVTSRAVEVPCRVENDPGTAIDSVPGRALENRSLLHGMPAMAAAAIQLWAKARYRARILVVVVQQTFGGFLNFHPHLHIMVSAGGLQESKNRWIHRLA